MNQITTENNADISKTLGIASSANRSRRLKRMVAWIALALVITIVVARFFPVNGNNIEYITKPAVRGNLCVTVSATGNLEPTNEVEVGSELSGIVKYVDVDYNDHVKVRQVLARLDATKLKAQVLQSKASLAAARAKVLEAQATVKEAKNELARLKYVQRIGTNKAVSQHDLDAADAALARAVADEENCKAEVLRCVAVLEYNETDLSKAIIVSPINGVVLSRSVEPGQTVAASLEAPVLFTLAEDLGKMELHVDVDEADVGKVQEGQEAVFTVDAYPDRKFPARIIQVRYSSSNDDDDSSSSSSTGVVTYETVLDVENSDLSLRPGMTATAEITVKKVENALLAPNAALRFAPPETKKDDAGNQGGGIMSKLLPRPPRQPSRNAKESNGAAKGPRVWTLQDGEPVAVQVAIGETDGAYTLIKDGSIQPDTPLVVDSMSVKQ
jgi:HlyD family secretion protein